MLRTEPFVVLVEDDSGMLMALERMLRIAGFRVATFATAETCLASDGAASADCLVCDVQLPGASGFEFCGQLVAGGSRIPTIFITAHDSRAARDAASRLNAAAFLVKPFDGGELIAAVQRAARPAS